MPPNLDRYHSDLKQLVRLGEEMLIDLSLRDAAIDVEREKLPQEIQGSFERKYQRWYTEAAAAVSQLIPVARRSLSSFTWAMETQTINSTTYNIQDWLTGQGLPCAARAKSLQRYSRCRCD